MHPSFLPIDELLADCELRRQRRSGPGGQHRNKVETAVVIRHIPSGVEAEASERRSQEQNRQVAIQRLRLQLACDVRTTPGEVPTELWSRRAKGRRISVSVNHDDFAALLAEGLDALFAAELEVPAAAEHLGISNSQLMRLLKLEPRVFAEFNAERQKRGMHRLR